MSVYRQLFNIGAAIGLTLVSGCCYRCCRKKPIQPPEQQVNINETKTENTFIHGKNNSVTDNSKTDISVTDNSKTDNSKTVNSKTDISKTDNSKTVNSVTDNSKTDNSKTDISKTNKKNSEFPEKPAEKTGKRSVVVFNGQRDLLRVIVTAEGRDADEKAFGADVVRRTQGALSADDAKVITDGNCDLRITVRPELTVVDQDGDYIRMNSETDIEIKSADGRRIFGVNRIKVDIPRRVLGKKAAITSLGTATADSASKWCREDLARIAKTEVGAIVFSIRWPDVPDKGPRDITAADIKSIGDVIADMKIVSYEFVGRERDVCRFRVVYFISAYPNGFVNEAGARLSQLVLE
jgi:hypothetical protein